MPTHLVRCCGKRSRTLFNRHLSQRNGERDRGLAHRNTGDDVSGAVLDRARQGRYSQFEVQRGLPIKLLVKHFTRVDEQWQIAPEVRAMVKYPRFNLLADFETLGTFRRYFNQDTESDVLRRLAEALSSDGYLVLGAAETASLQNGQRSTGPLHAQHDQPAPSGTATNDARAAPPDCDQWRPIERISANKNPGEGRGFENTEQDFRPGFLPLLPMAPAARSRGPTRSRCNSCHSRRWRAFSGACR